MTRLEVNITDKIKISLEDNIELMKRYPDGYFDLAIVDPPYGLGIHGQKEDKKGKKSDRKFHENKNWDNKIPDKEYFDELFRVSKNQIIWGGNYMIEYLYPTKGWIFWYKGQRDLTMSDGELAWTSIKTVTRQVEINRGVLNSENTFHPTQKPVKLYKWLLSKYAKKGDKILDTHLGSGSIGIACHDYDFDLVACEIDKDYFVKTKERLINHVGQLKINL